MRFGQKGFEASNDIGVVICNVGSFAGVGIEIEEQHGGVAAAEVSANTFPRANTNRLLATEFSIEIGTRRSWRSLIAEQHRGK